jgi:hypothetical protein
MDRNIYLSPSPFHSGLTFPSLHGQKYLPASPLSLFLSLWIYLSAPLAGAIEALLVSPAIPGITSLSVNFCVI